MSLSSPRRGARRIEDYALIGDTHTAALVGNNGSIDWLCLPRFDSGACFAALLGESSHGRWLIAPREPVVSVRRRYEPGTLVLVTEFTTASGVVEVCDFMPPRDSSAPQVVRIVRGVRGSVEMRMELVIRFDYGVSVPWVSNRDGVLRAIAGPNALYLRGGEPTSGQGLTTVAHFVGREDKPVRFVLGYYPSHLPVPPPVEAERALDETIAWWRAWSSQCTYRGASRELVERSLITLKALTFAPTGGIIAAPTTSLPEHLGGVRNWDYRFCWLRDATFTLYALMMAGYRDEALAWRDWLVRAIAGDPAQMQIVYGAAGERNLWEIELPWLPGYEHSRPVRIGNGAVTQCQLDVYGEVLDALYLARRSGMGAEPRVWAIERALLRYLETNWQAPDSGIWEVRGPRRQFTHSKVMAWVAFDRGIKSAERFGLRAPIEPWKVVRDRIHREICERGYHPTRKTFTQYYGGEKTDASLLMMAFVGFLPPTDERVRGTVAAVERELLRDDLVLRYSTEPGENSDGLPGKEGVFLPCTFWLADNYALMGRVADAERLFRRVLALANDVGLLSEEYDVEHGRLIGNFPQAFTHVGLINTAKNLSDALRPAEDRQCQC